MLASLSCQSPGYIPCCFMLFQVLQKQCADDFDFFDRQLELGLDVRVELPDLPIRFDPFVSVRTWKERPAGATAPLLHKQYDTPSGTITTVVRQTEDWPYGDQVPLFDDYLTPRTEKYLVSEPADLAGLRHLLVPPSDADIAAFRESAAKYKQYAENKGLLFSGGWRDWRADEPAIVGANGGTMGIDALIWLCGAVPPLLWAYDQPEFLAELIKVITVWNRRRMEIILDSGVDVIMKRAWYEGTELWSPRLYRQFIAPVLREDVTLAHQAGAKFGYFITSGTLPILDQLLDLEVDVIIGVDPVMGKGTELDVLARRASDQICLWGGVNAPLSVEGATSAEIWRAVEHAVTACGPHGGFILSPVDNILDPSPQAWQNLLELISAWQHLGANSNPMEGETL